MKNTPSNTYILRQLLPSQWEEYKSIRLEALLTNPEMFGSNYAKESVYSQSDWVSFLENESRALFALYDNERLIGLTGVAIKKEDASTAILFASFIKKQYRGMGLSKLFFEARINWARQKHCKFITVSHRAGNVLSKAAILRHGFTYSHAEDVNWPDGVCAEELKYLLEL